jgi:dCTP deaminase
MPRMILPDHQIRWFCQKHAMVVPFSEDQLNPASYDVLLGDRLMIEVPEHRDMQIHGIAGHTADDPYWLQPGEFVLAQTQEIFNIPDSVAAQFVLKSSRAREGLEHLLAGFADPGFHGSVLTLELQNARRLHPVALWPGMKIGQLVFFQMAGLPDVSYAVKGHYNRDEAVTASKGHL